jgi:hypothetical protein
LATTGFGEFERSLHLREFVLAADEPGEPAPRRRLQTRTQGAESRHLVDAHGLVYALDPIASEAGWREVDLPVLWQRRSRSVVQEEAGRALPRLL